MDFVPGVGVPVDVQRALDGSALFSVRLTTSDFLRCRDTEASMKQVLEFLGIPEKANVLLGCRPEDLCIMLDDVGFNTVVSPPLQNLSLTLNIGHRGPIRS